MTNKDKALAVLRAKLDEASIKIGTYKAAVSLLGEKDITPARQKGIAEFFKRWVNE